MKLIIKLKYVDQSYIKRFLFQIMYDKHDEFLLNVYRK